MAINLSNLIGGGSGSSTGTVIGEFHALSRTADGMLVYTLLDASATSDVINVKTSQAAGQFNNITDDYVAAIPSGRAKQNLNGVGDLNYANDKYQQYRYDTRKVRYFISNGNMYARLNGNYSYTGPK
jgi:hypothetical protein